MKKIFVFNLCIIVGFYTFAEIKYQKNTNHPNLSSGRITFENRTTFVSPENSIRHLKFGQSNTPSISEWLRVTKSHNISSLSENTPFENGFIILFKNFFSEKSGDWKVQYQTSYGEKNIREIQMQQNPLLFEHRLIKSYFLIYKGNSESNRRLTVSYDRYSVEISFNAEDPEGLKMAQELRNLIMKYHDQESPFHGRVLEFLPDNTVGFYKGVENYKYQWNDLILDPLIKNDLQSTIDSFVNNYNLNEWEKLGLPLNRGVLIHGPPGTGKSLLAKVLVSNVIQSRYKNRVSYIHVQSRHVLNPDRIRTIYQAARLLSPTIVFFEDIDLIAGTGRFDRPRFKNELMQQLSGVESLKGVITIGSTNFFERIDPALKRTKRLGFDFLIGLPKGIEREKLIQAMLSKWSVDSQVSFFYLSQITEGFSGADLKEFIDLAVESSLRESPHFKQDKNIVLKLLHFEEALKIKNKYQSIQKSFSTNEFEKLRR